MKISKIFLFTIFAILAIALFAFDIDVGSAVSMAALPAALFRVEGNNMAGFTSKMYIIKTSDVTSIGTATNKTISTITLKADKDWTEVYCTPEEGGLKLEGDGPTDGKFFRAKGQLFYPNITAESKLFADELLGADVLICMQETSTGKWTLIGSLELPAKLSPSAEYGTAYGDKKGWTFEINAPMPITPCYYTGTFA